MVRSTPAATWHFLKQLLTDDYAADPLLALVAEVTFSGEKLPSRWDNVESAAETSQEYEQSFAVLIERLDELTGLADSWFDDASTAPSAESVELAREIAAALQSDGLPAPIAFPTPHGGISLEWIVEPLDTDEDSFEKMDTLTPERVVEYLSLLVGEQNG